ncbi:MAG: hypothetical protein RLY86_1229 [Pseudomonadota bacterium]|jgi:ribosomal protein S12 methylthiotransferase
MERQSPQAAPKVGPQVGFVSLGCSKALVDSERIITRLRAEGYGISPTYQDADVVVVNTCGFLNSAKQHSLDTIGKAIAENGKVIVTGCLGVEPARIRETHPTVLAVTGPQQYDAVLKAVRDAAPIEHSPFTSLLPPGGLKLTPRHYSYLKISEGCNNKCTFCIIPDIRGRLASRTVGDVLREAEALVKAGTKELLVVSQDTSAYGVDLKYAEDQWRDKAFRTKLKDLCLGLSELGVWTRLHYVYPYPEVDDLIELMVDGKLLPYLDIPFQHAAPNVLKAMKRPANQEKVLNRIKSWRAACPEISIRSTFIVGFPGETEEDYEYLLQWLDEAEIDRVGCFRYEHVDGAKANDLPGYVPEEIKDLRFNRLMDTQQAISARVLGRRVGRTTTILIDEVDEDGAIGRTPWDAPEVDGITFLNGETKLKPGDRVTARIDHSDEYDFWATRVDA